MEIPQPVIESNVLTLVPRVTTFANQYVTKADEYDPYSDAEKKITSLAVLVFDSEGTLVYIEEASGNSPFTLNKSMLNIAGATLVMFANADIAILKNAPNLTLESLETYALTNASPVVTAATITDENFKGLPMMGKLENVDLTATTTSQGTLSVSLKILYAKVNFTIGVAQGTENQGTGSFKMNNLSVYNAALTTKIAAETFADANSTYTATETGTAIAQKTDGTYTFYVSENRYNPGNNLAGIYPDDDWLTNVPADDVKNYVQGTDDDKLNGVKYFYDDLIQQYKPKLATKGSGQATYALLNGVYTDYRGTAWNVKYKIYLGKDNAMNFEVDRNSEYSNSITIKGIRNNDSYGTGDVWIDHRVNVSTDDLSGNATITRETLIDSHIEVRPLRVKWEGNTYAGVRIYLPTDSNGNLISWIGIEKFTGENCLESSTYCYAGTQPTGKRKYFTTSLLSELQTKGGEFGVETTDDGQKFLFLRNGDCAWIYFDENTSSSERSAEIKLQFLDADGNSKGNETYQVTQRGLLTVAGYTIESYEEYLHTYDSSDKYNLSTSPIDYTQQGLAWGLANKQISKDIIVSAGPLEGIQGIVSQRYDFFHSSDVPSGNSYYTYTNVSGSWANASYGTGLVFTDRASANEKITIKDMGTIPSSAYQYCLSKNKFKEDADGNHTLDIHWYLPDVYELSAVLAASQSSVDLSTDAYYWSSQPSYEGWGLDQIPGIGQYLDNVNILNEVSVNSRAATKGSATDLPRTEKHRIRCIYSSSGIKNVDMSDRAPDGMGGNFTFWMKGWTDGGKTTPGFFNYMLPDPSEPTGSTEKSTVPNVTIPTKANSQSADVEFPYIVTQGKNGQIEGFQKNPGDKNNWNTYTLSSTHYYTLRDYPGLSDYTLNKATLTDAYEETSTRKSITESSAKTSIVQKTQNLPSTFTLNPLDDKLKISFAQADGNNVPVFTYDELYSQVQTTSTQYWNKPVYTGTTHEMEPQTATESDSGSGSSELDYVTWPTNTLNISKQTIFSIALREAKDDALEKLEAKIKEDAKYQGWTYDADKVSYSPEPSTLSWDTNSSSIKYETREEGSWVKRKIVKCTITLTATLTLSKSSQIVLYTQTSGGVWSDPTTTTSSTGPTVNTDQLRVYCGNSFTISLSDAYKDDYEITKVKIHYSAGNLIKSTTLPQSSTHARFVESSLIPDGTGVRTIAEKSVDLNFENLETITLNGMDYSADSNNSDGWNQWTGKGTDSITLVLTDYHIQNGDWTNWTDSEYSYKTASVDLSKYIIVDRIEVKCTKKSTVSN